jgi:DNA-binding winged helix-turn-helix (wHTH) protein/TolB-like protein
MAMIYSFDEYSVDTVKRIVSKDGSGSVSLKPKAFDALLYLIENRERVVERDELMNALWFDTVVEENNLTQHISALRRVFGEAPGEHRYIVTVPGHGYKFVADVKTSDGNGTGTERATAAIEKAPGPNRRTLLILGAICVVGLLATIGFFVLPDSSKSTGSIRSIAVLPFKPLVVANRDEALEMGMADTLISKLGGRDDMVIRPLTAVRRFGSPEQDAVEAGRILGVDAVLDGSIQIAGDRVRISTTLLSVRDSKQIWSQQFDEKLTDIFAVQDSISERVVAALKLEPGKNAAHRYTENAEAYRLFVRGRFHNMKLTPADSQKALSYYQQAIDIDPNYALAYAGISHVYRTLALSSEEPPQETFEKSIAAAERAIAIDSDLAEGHAALGIATFFFKRDWAASEASFRRSIELDPNWSFARIYYAHLLSNIGRHAEALANAKRAREIEPVSPFISSLEGLILQQADRPDDAIKQYGSATEIDPNFWMPYMFTARAYLDKKMYAEALEPARKATELSPAQSMSMAYECFALGKLGRVDEAKSVLDALLERSRQRYVMPYHIAVGYLGLGDRENALRWLEKSVAENDSKAVFLKVEHTWDEMRDERRFKELLRKMNF